MDAAAWIDLVLTRSADLRSAGVVSIGCDGCTVTLGPVPDLEIQAGPGDAKQAEEPYLNALNDPASYKDGVVPGFTIERFTPEDY